jgi:hypothetical protein
MSTMPSGLKAPVDAVLYLIVIDEIATVRGGNALFHSSDKAGLIFEHSIHSFLHQLLGGRAVMVGDLRKLGFLLRSEMDFHTLLG